MININDAKINISKNDLQNLKDMGFSEPQIIVAYKTSQTTKKPILDILLDSLSSTPVQQNSHSKLQPMSPEKRERKQTDAFVGLKNIGNTCYFNSLLQSYYFNPFFVKLIMEFTFPNAEKSKLNKKQKQNLTLLQEIQHLFSQMTLGNQRYADPSEVLNNIYDDFGNQLLIGEEKDLSELNLTFLARIDEIFRFTYGIMEKSITESQMNEEMMVELKDEEGYEIISPIKSLRKQHFQVANYVASEITKMYFVKFFQIISWREVEKTTNKCQELNLNEQIMSGPIILDISHGNFYSSYEAFHNSEVCNFETPTGSKVDAHQIYWIYEAPKTLTFQLQRVVFDKKNLRLAKLNNKFTFDQEIYIDRYMFINKNQYEETQNQIKEMQNEINELTTQINLIINFNNSDMSLVNILSQSIIYFKNKENQLKKKNSFDLIEDQVQKGQEEQSITALEKQLDTESDKLKQLKLKKSILEQKQIALFQSLKKNKYILISILMHEGSAQSGHYYSYNFDISKQKWFWFSDIYVREVDNQEQIFIEGFGGNKENTKSAYCLVYLKEAGLKQNDIGELYDYKRFIPAEFRQKIETGNKKFLQEVQIHKVSLQCNSILEQYSDRFQFCNEMAREYLKNFKQKNQQSPPCIVNFGVFLKLQQKDTLYKIHLLDSSIQYVSNGSLSLDNILNNQVFVNKLQEQFSMFSNFKAPGKLKLNSHEQSEMDQLQYQYIKIILVAELYLLQANFLLNNKYVESFQCAKKIVESLEKIDQNKYFIKLEQEILFIISLRFCKKLTQSLNQSEEQFELNSKIILATAQLLNEKFQKQIAQIFKDMSESNLTHQFYGILTPNILSILENYSTQISSQQFDEIELQSLKQSLKNTEFEEKYKQLALHNQSIQFQKWEIKTSDFSLMNQIKVCNEKIPKQFKDFCVVSAEVSKINNPLSLEERIQMGLTF